MSLIPLDDPIPVKALLYIAKKHSIVPEGYEYWKLPIKNYNQVLKIIRDEY